MLWASCALVQNETVGESDGAAVGGDVVGEADGSIVGKPVGLKVAPGKSRQLL